MSTTPPRAPAVLALCTRRRVAAPEAVVDWADTDALAEAEADLAGEAMEPDIGIVLDPSGV